MVVLTPHFTSLLAFAASGSMLMVGVDALPYRPDTGDVDEPGSLLAKLSHNLPLPALLGRHEKLDLESRYYRSHPGHRRDLEALDLDWGDDDEGNLWGGYGTENPVVDSGTENYHTHKRRHSHHGGRPLHKLNADKRSHRRRPHHHGDHHRHHGGHHRHHGDRHRHHGHGTKVYADDPLIVSGDNNHIHSHSHKKRSEGPVVLRRTPCGKLDAWYSSRSSSVDSISPHRPVSLLVDSIWQGFRRLEPGTANYKRAPRKHHGPHHRHHQDKPLELTVFNRQRGKRGLLDPLVPLFPGIAGVIDIVNTAAHAVLSDKLASLIITSKPSTMGAQSVGGELGYMINASNSTSTTMYLVPQDTPANLGPSEKVVLITMPVVQSKDQGVKSYCASYDPNSASPSQLSSQPCVYNGNAGLDINSTSTHLSQLFSWNIEDGTINPLWLNQAEPALVDTTSAPGGASDPADIGGYVIGGAPSLSAANAGQPSRSFGMIFRATSPASSPPSTSMESTPSPDASPATSEFPNSTTDGQAATYPDEGAPGEDPDDQSQASQANDGSYDDEDTSSESYKGSPDDTRTHEDDVIEEESLTAQGSDPSTVLDQGPTPTTAGSTQESMQAKVVTSTFTMLVAPTQSMDVLGTEILTASTDSAATPTATM